MSGRLSAPETDSEESYDVVNETTQQGEPAGIEATDYKGPTRNGAETDDVEAYLRSRHRRRVEKNVSGRKGPDEGSRTDDSHAPEWHAPDATAFLAKRSDSDVSKPYLDRLPDGYSAQLELFEWLDGLLSTAGRERTMAALDYYQSIGWLSEHSREKLERIASGLTVPDATDRSLDIEDHRESLVYVARLAHRSRE